MRTMVEEEEMGVAGPPGDTELTLGMKSLLGIFFGSVLICGVFFGFGYSLGRGYTHGSASSAAPAPAIVVKPAAPSDSTETANAAVPAAPQSEAGDSNPQTVVSDSQGGASSTGSDASQPEPASHAASQSAAASQASQQYEYVATPDGPARRPVGAPEKNPGRAAANATTLAAVPQPAMIKPSAAIVHQEPALVEAPAVQPRPQQVLASVTRTPAATPALVSAVPAVSSGSAGGTMVQIAAVSHQEDANILVGALRRRGYEVLVRNEPKDTLFHVQVGPFASRDQAKAMRNRLLADGYNAILK